MFNDSKVDQDMTLDESYVVKDLDVLDSDTVFTGGFSQ